MKRANAIVPSAVRKWDVCVVQWEDAITARGYENPSEFIVRYKPCMREHVGYYLGISADCVHVTDCKDGDDDCDGITSIPLSLVRQFRIVK